MGSASSGGSSRDTSSYGFALVSLTTLFFMWGFITCLNDILVPHLKNVFSLNYTQSMLIQFCFFGAYFLMSLPAGAIVKRVGYKGGIVIGLLISAIGCFLFVPAASLISYPFFLGALFVLATGVTLLQVSANPYVNVLGDPATAPARLTLTQAFNSLGTTIAPSFGAFLILSSAAVATSDMNAAAEADTVKVPYMILAAAFLVLAAVFALLKLPKVDGEDDASAGPVDPNDSAWKHPTLVLGALGLFLYVGAEVSIGSFLVNFINQPDIGNLDEATAAHYVAYYWGGAMVGRFIGSFAMRYVDGGKVLAFNAVMAIVLLVLTMATTGHTAMYAVLAIGLFNSVMFPTIFSLGLVGLGRLTSQGSGILCLAIVGGAVLPVIQGWLADTIGLQNAFFMPIICYAYIAYYGVKGHVQKGQKAAPAKAA